MENRFQNDTVCVYHKNCMDGLAAAWVVWKAYKGNVDTIAMQYGDDLNAAFGENFDSLIGKKVICVDFAFDKQTTLKLAEVCDLLVLDHHASAARDLKDICFTSFVQAFDEELKRHGNIFVYNEPQHLVVVDSRHSGARLAWEWFFHGHLPPTPIKYVEDYDLWRLNYSASKPWVAAAFSGEMTVEQFNTYVDANPIRQADLIEQMVIEGKAIQRHIDKTVKGLARSARRFILDGLDVPIVNANSLFRNELGAILSAGELFSVTYSDNRDSRQYSLRSKPDGVDVGAIAKKFGGGGHPNSAAFSIKMTDEQFHHSHQILESTKHQRIGNEWKVVPRYATKES